ncbi:MAG: hypothetical protein HQL58_05945 [Magnetococcales bacterium]|nr:hypothetical protein [Magnetococcales bacterium]
MMDSIVSRMQELLNEIMLVDEIGGERVGQLAHSWEEVVLMLEIGCSSGQLNGSTIDRDQGQDLLAQLQDLSQRIPVALSRLAQEHSRVAQQLFAENRRMLSLRGYAPPQEMVLRHYI